jgi:hypothetical protein
MNPNLTSIRLRFYKQISTETIGSAEVLRAARHIKQHLAVFPEVTSGVAEYVSRPAFINADRRH